MSYYMIYDKTDIQYYINWNDDNPIRHSNISLLVIKDFYNDTLPISFKRFTKLDVIFIENCYYLMEIPSMKGLTNLKSLYFKNLPSLIHIPDLDIPSLEKLTFYKVGITELPEFSNLVKLSYLSIEKTDLKICPILDCLKNLEHLEIISCEHIAELPSFDKLINLKELIISGTELSTLPSLSNLIKLEKINFSFNNFKTIPNLDNLTLLKELNVSGLYELEYLPSLDCLINLETLSCDDCALKELPNLSNLTHLNRLYCINCKLTNLPDMSNLINLESLLCFDNMITSLPLSILNCKILDPLIKNCKDLMYVAELSYLLNEKIANYYYKPIISKLNARILKIGV